MLFRKGFYPKCLTVTCLRNMSCHWLTAIKMNRARWTCCRYWWVNAVILKHSPLIGSGSFEWREGNTASPYTLCFYSVIMSEICILHWILNWTVHSRARSISGTNLHVYYIPFLYILEEKKGTILSLILFEPNKGRTIWAWPSDLHPDLATGSAWSFCWPREGFCPEGWLTLSDVCPSYLTLFQRSLFGNTWIKDESREL